jgi:hypothetical protein
MSQLSDAGLVLLASCGADEGTGGGLVSYDGSRTERIDRVSSMGLALAGNRLARLLRDLDQPGAAAELLVYDERGVQRYYRLDAVSEGHDLAWDGSSFIVVSTATNTIVWVSPSGEITRTWKAPGEGDAWHLNDLLLKDGDVYVAGFRKDPQHRAWASHLEEPSGFVMSVTTGQDALQGITCPHSPRFFDGAWAVCNSAGGELLQFDQSGREVARRLKLEGWTRGLAVGDELLFVGESGIREPFAGGASTVAIVDRASWSLMDRVSLPCDQIYDLALAPISLLEGLRRGFRTNARRNAEQDQYAMFRRVGIEPRLLWAISDPLPPEACRVRIELAVPEVLGAGTQVELPCVLENLGPEFLVSAPPYPVTIACKWIPSDSELDDQVIESDHWRLPQTLPPRHPVEFGLKIPIPAQSGAFRLRVTLVQEQVRWFDDVDPANACERLVQIVMLDGGAEVGAAPGQAAADPQGA